jgi:hypothetical protein
VSGAGRKANERERSGERHFRKKRGAGAEREIGERERSVFKGRLNDRSPFGLTNNFFSESISRFS